MPFDISGWYLIGVNHNDSVKSTIESAGVTLGTDISLIVACAAMTRSQTENTNYDALGNLNETLSVPDISCGVVEYHAGDSILGGVTTNAFGNNNWAKVLDADASFVLSPYPSVGVWCLIEKLAVSSEPQVVTFGNNTDRQLEYNCSTGILECIKYDRSDVFDFKIVAHAGSNNYLTTILDPKFTINNITSNIAPNGFLYVNDTILTEEQSLGGFTVPGEILINNNTLDKGKLTGPDSNIFQLTNKWIPTDENEIITHIKEFAILNHTTTNNDFQLNIIF